MYLKFRAIMFAEKCSDVSVQQSNPFSPVCTARTVNDVVFCMQYLPHRSMRKSVIHGIPISDPVARKKNHIYLCFVIDYGKLFLTTSLTVLTVLYSKEAKSSSPNTGVVSGMSI